MHPRLRARFVRDLVRDIELLSGAAFETFAYAIIASIRPSPHWNHAGTNLAGAPVKGVVDSVADGGQLVAQYSSDAGFFSGDLSKAKQDIAQARTNHPNVKELWLLSTRIAGPSGRTKASQLEAAQKSKGLDLHILDGRKLAAHLVDNLDKDVLIRATRDLLGSLRRIEDEYAFTHMVAPDPTYIPRPDLEKALSSTLTAARIAEIGGISGIGKSALANGFLQRVRDSYEHTIWVDASRISSIAELYAVDVRQRGDSVNLHGLIKRRFCLVVLDDVRQQLPLDEFVAAAHPRSRIIVTSQVASSRAQQLTMLDRALARQLLEIRASSPCPDDVFDTVWSAFGGHPSALSLLGGLVKEDAAGWEAVRLASIDPGGLPDEKYQRLADRILTRHKSQLANEIALLALGNASRVDTRLWNAVCGPHSVRALRQRGMLVTSTSEVVRVHDLVFASARTLHDGSSATVAAGASACVESLDDDDGTLLDRVARMHRDLFERLAIAPGTTAAIRYGFALGRPRQRDSLLLEAVSAARKLAGKAFEPATTMVVRAALESLEALYTSTKDAAGSAEEARRVLGALFDAYDDIARVRYMPDALAGEVTHHRAKMQLWLQRTDEARAAFEELVRADPSHAAARLQLARIHADRGDGPAARAQVDAILALPDASTAKVLAAFVLLKSKALRQDLLAIVRHYEALFLRSFERALSHGQEQAVGVIASLGGDLWYEARPLLVKVARIVRDIPFLPSRRAMFEWAQCLKHCAKAIADTDPGASRGMLHQAKEAYAAAALTREYELTQRAECLILLGDGVAAGLVLERVPQGERGVHWQHRRAQSLRLSQDLSAALQAVDAALAIAEERFKSAFLHERYAIRRAANDSGAQEDLREAIAKCGSVRYHAALEAELQALAQQNGRGP
jgi:tetratricopeptide (TPR) repeat protein